MSDPSGSVGTRMRRAVVSRDGFAKAKDGFYTESGTDLIRQLVQHARPGGGRIEPAERDHRPPSTGGVRLYVEDGGETFQEEA